MASERPGTLVASNVLLDVVTDDPRWGDWSAERLAHALVNGGCELPGPQVA